MTKHTLVSPEKQRLARMLKALGNPVRFQIVEFLAERQLCITKSSRIPPLAQSTVSQRLKVLREAGLAPLVRKVHLLDGSSAMLEAARQNLAHFANLEFHHAYGLALPLPDSARSYSPPGASPVSLLGFSHRKGGWFLPL